MFVTENFWSRSGSQFVTETFGVIETPSVTSVESSEQFWRIFANPGVVLLFAAKRVYVERFIVT